MFDHDYDDTFFTDDATDWELDQLAGEQEFEDEDDDLPTDAFDDWRDEEWSRPSDEDAGLYGDPECW